MTINLLVSAIAGSQIGTGHLRRMLTLCAELQRHPGLAIHLHSSGLGIEIARASGLNFGDLLTGPDSSEAAIEDLVALVARCRPDILVLDNYFWHQETEERLRPHCPRLCVVDDLADRPHVADLLLDQNANHQAADYAGLVPETCQLAIGSAYCLISEPFQRLRRTARVDPVTRADCNRVFVSLGGGDPRGDLPRILEVLLRGTDLDITLATGSHIRDAALLQQIASRYPTRVEVVFDSPRVAEQMNSAGFAVSSGGTMIWERAILGLPTLCLIIADNQVETAKWMEQQGMHRHFDMRGQWSEADLLAAIRSYAGDRTTRIAHAKGSMALVDGTGATNAARAILSRATDHDVKEARC